MLVTTLVALGRLYRLESPTPAAGSPPEPTSVEPAQAADQIDGVTCRPEPGVPGTFRVSFTPATSAPVSVTVDLVDGNGSRHGRVAELAAGAGGELGATVTGPPDTSSCLVTGFQLGDRVIDTGR
jgi:hypothetical protein